MSEAKRLYSVWKDLNTPERFGQFFVNKYASHHNPLVHNDPDLNGLFYTTDDDLAMKKIDSWMERHCYTFGDLKKFLEVELSKCGC